MKYRRKYTLFRVKTKGKPMWYFRIYLPDGTRRSKSTGCRSKEKAMMYVDSVLADDAKIRKVFESDLIVSFDNTNTPIQFADIPQQSTGKTFNEFASPWWDWENCPYVLARRAAGTENHPGIKQSYVKNARLWTQNYLIPFFRKYKLHEINVDMINNFWMILKDKYGLAPKTINNIRSIFMVIMKDAVSRNLIPSNPVEKTIPRTVEKKKHELLTDEECSRLFDMDRIDEIWNGKIVYYVYSFVAGLTGLRAGELLALTINEVKQDRIYVKRSYNESYGMSTTKTSEERIVPITSEIYRYLYVAWQSHPNDDADFIFSFDGKKPMNEGRARAAFYRAMERIGISEKERKRRGITFHSWRHKFTTDCVKSNMHPEKIMALTGHRSSQMLSRYTDLNPEKDLASQVHEIQNEKSRRIILDI